MGKRKKVKKGTKEKGKGKKKGKLFLLCFPPKKSEKTVGKEFQKCLRGGGKGKDFSWLP